MHFERHDQCKFCMKRIEALRTITHHLTSITLKFTTNQISTYITLWALTLSFLPPHHLPKSHAFIRITKEWSLKRGFERNASSWRSLLETWKIMERKATRLRNIMKKVFFDNCHQSFGKSSSRINYREAILEPKLIRKIYIYIHQVFGGIYQISSFWQPLILKD